MSETRTMTSKKTLDLLFVSLGAALITICSWISFPMTVPVTLQTFAVFAVAGLLGLKRGMLSVVVYILLGAIGVPVFSGFTGGIGILFGKTGGYIIGFIFAALIVGLAKKFFGDKLILLIVSMVIGLLVCYAFGTAWFMYVYTQSTGTIGMTAVLGWCVFPFIIPDIIKIALAAVVVNRTAKHVQF